MLIDDHYESVCNIMFLNPTQSSSFEKQLILISLRQRYIQIPVWRNVGHMQLDL